MKRWVSLFTIVVFFCVVTLQGWGQEQEEKKEKSGTYFEGLRDGEREANRSGESERGMGVAMGCCLGIIGFAYPATINPAPPYGVIEGMSDKTEDYKQGFYNGYKEQKKREAWDGTITGVVLLVVAGIVFSLWRSGQEQEQKDDIWK